MAVFDQRWQHVQTQYNAGRDINIVLLPDTKAPLAARRNRQAMLDRVEHIWIKGLLERSPAQAGQFALELREKPQNVVNPWGTLVPDLVQASRVLPRGTQIAQVYDNAGGTLLILGEPGAGKSTILLVLLRDLLVRARASDTHPIPIVFHLASWAVQRQPLAIWLVEELFTRYQVPRKMGRQWVETDQLVVLLDGLDEVKASQRAACVEAINTYHQEHFSVPVVVCCRQAEYQQMKRRLRLEQAVLVQPLAPQQIDTYLKNAGPQAASIRTVLRQDNRLQQIASTPLMLNMLTQTYQGKPDDNMMLMPGNSPEGMRQQVLETYVRRLFERRGARTQYSQQQTMRGLAWLARQLTNRSQTTFSIERLQSDWLPPGPTRRMYYLLVALLVALLLGWAGWFVQGALSGLLIGVLLTLLLLFDLMRQAARGNPDTIPVLLRKPSFGRNFFTWLLLSIIGGLPLGVILGGVLWFSEAESSKRVSDTIVGGMWFWLVAASVFGLILGLVRQREKRRFAQRLVRPWQQLRRDLYIEWLFVLIGGLCCGVINWSIFAHSIDANNLLLFSLLLGSLGGLFCGLLSVLLPDLLEWQITIEPAEAVVWSWQRFWQGLITSFLFKALIGLLAGVLIGIFFGLIVGSLGFIALPTSVVSHLPPPASFNDAVKNIVQSIVETVIQALIYLVVIPLFLGVFGGAFLGLLSGLIGLLAAGLSSTKLDPESFTRANQGIRRSFKNALVLGLLTMLVVVGISGIVGLVSGKDLQGFGFGGIFALFIGPILWLRFGGLACIQHFILRWLLAQSGEVPWDLPRFLDEASEATFLSKVGGSYIFTHRLLLDYFASLQGADRER